MAPRLVRGLVGSGRRRPLVRGERELVSSPDPDLFRSAFQSSNSIGQFIIHDYMGIRAVALTTP